MLGIHFQAVGEADDNAACLGGTEAELGGGFSLAFFERAAPVKKHGGFGDFHPVDNGLGGEHLAGPIGQQIGVIVLALGEIGVAVGIGLAGPIPVIDIFHDDDKIWVFGGFGFEVAFYPWAAGAVFAGEELDIGGLGMGEGAECA